MDSIVGYIIVKPDGSPYCFDFGGGDLDYSVYASKEYAERLLLVFQNDHDLCKRYKDSTLRKVVITELKE